MSFRSLRLGRARPGSSVVVAVAMGALLATGCASARTKIADAISADAITVDGTSIAQRDFRHDVSALASSAKLVALDKAASAQGGASRQPLFDSKGQPTRVLTTSWLNRLANQLVIDNEFAHLHLKVTATDLSEGESQFAQLFATSSASGAPVVAQFPKWFREQEKKREARLVAVTRVLDSQHPITKAQMLAFYKKNVGNLCPSGVNVAHILVKTLPDAQAIETQLAAGAEFAALAQSKSIDTTSGKQGGSLGCLATGQFVPAFEQAATKAKVGVPTTPVHTQYGYHVILTTKFVPPAFESVQTQIRQAMLKDANIVSTFVHTRLQKAKVRVDPLYGTWSRAETKVVAPKVPSVRNSRNATTTPTS
jgi:hypothetical protein